MKKIISVVGARPQFIKLGPLSREIRKKYKEVIIHTGQHYDHEMSDLFFEQLEIPKPDFNLGIGSASHGVQTGKMLEGIEKVIIKEKPDLVLTFGDTNSTLAACVAASKLEMRSLHIEAGLRSFNRSMPEEINRVVADHTADLLFAPTEEAVGNLTNEGLKDRTVMVGDIMVDSIKFVQGKLPVTKRDEEEFYLMTLHRPYNVDNPDKLKSLFKKLNELKVKVLFTAHPRTKKVLDTNSITPPANIKIIPPQGYMEFQELLRDCEKVLTDSGGVQKEAYIAGKPCITIRPETEWIETVESGWNELVEITDSNLAQKIEEFKAPQNQKELFGSNVAEKMIKVISDFI